MHKFSRAPMKLAVAVAAAVGVSASPVVLSQGVLEEVIVTAQKREQSLQDVPIAVAAMSGETIDDIGIRDLEELTLYIPNVNINQGQASANLFIRGVGYRPSLSNASLLSLLPLGILTSHYLTLLLIELRVSLRVATHILPLGF